MKSIVSFSRNSLNESTDYNGQQEIVQENQQQTKQTTEGSKLIQPIKSNIFT
jgi:hypothetical protein